MNLLPHEVVLLHGRGDHIAREILELLPVGTRFLAQDLIDRLATLQGLSPRTQHDCIRAACRGITRLGGEQPIVRDGNRWRIVARSRGSK